jgi:hypothetical protein
MAENVGRRGESWFFRVDLPGGRRRHAPETVVVGPPTLVVTC